MAEGWEIELARRHDFVTRVPVLRRKSVIIPAQLWITIPGTIRFVVGNRH